MTPMNDCCHAYLKHGAELIAEWLGEDDPHIELKYRVSAAHDSAVVHAKILAGTYTTRDGPICCPWGDMPERGINGYMNYLAVMKAVAEPDFESRIGPIEVIPESER